jgi:hypothetical protein
MFRQRRLPRRRGGRGGEAADMAPQQQPVGGAGHQRGCHPDLEERDQAYLGAGRANRGEAARAERAAGEPGAEPDDQGGQRPGEQPP